MGDDPSIPTENSRSREFDVDRGLPARGVDGIVQEHRQCDRAHPARHGCDRVGLGRRALEVDISDDLPACRVSGVDSVDPNVDYDDALREHPGVDEFGGPCGDDE